ncbi:hypothetical protein ZWY2020_054612 [Hordeum vulgare]|nr:hypothetical protein ZWY2020_054612 [Hordeum vulgare]
MREELAMNKVRDVAKLYALLDRCARVDEGRRLTGENAGVEADSKDKDADVPAKRGKWHNKKRNGKTVFAVEATGDADSATKAKAEASSKDVARHVKEKAQQGGEGYGGKKGAQGSHPGKFKGKKARPVQPREKTEEDDEDFPDDDSSDHKFQRATDMMCLEGGASLHSSHCQLKKWVREVIAAEPSIGTRKPLRWSRTPIIFDSKDHADRVTAVACLPLLVSSTILNLRIPDEDLEDTGAFEGINPGKIQPKGKITLPVTFGSDQNYQTEKVVYDVADNPFAYNGMLGRPTMAKFMVDSHYAYDTLKMFGSVDVIVVHADKKDVLRCMDRLYREAMAALVAKVPSLSTPARTPGDKKDDGGASRVDPGMCASLECCATGKDAP